MINVVSIYRSLHVKFTSQKRINVIKASILNILPKNEVFDSWLDVGTGDGVLMQQIYKSIEDRIMSLKGLDIRMCLDSLVPSAVYDGQRVPFFENSFYIVSFIDTLHHTHDIFSLLKEAKRVAKKYVLIKDVLYEKEWQLISLRVQDWFGNVATGCPLVYNFLKKKQWQEVFERLGLKILVLRSSIEFKYLFPFNVLCPGCLHFICLLEAT
ncbi:MAG: methyltransferase domain-containing protein [Candidatus Omnitrophica bacterium]|nr:methyltransferase domain-containing protein [Candidatus Omnitrophota bacterium]